MTRESSPEAVTASFVVVSASGSRASVSRRLACSLAKTSKTSFEDRTNLPSCSSFSPRASASRLKFVIARLMLRSRLASSVLIRAR